MSFLRLYTWEDVEQRNKDLCKHGGYQQGRTSGGYEKALALFNSFREDKDALLADTIDHLRQLHRASPFLFLNGNTFSSIGRDLLIEANVISQREFSLVGHHIAGTQILTLAELRKALPEILPKQDRELDRIKSWLHSVENGAMSLDECLCKIGKKKSLNLTSEQKQLTYHELKRLCSGKLDLDDFEKNFSSRIKRT